MSNQVNLPPKKSYSKIKNVFFPLRNYTFDHGQNKGDKPNHKFIGRDKIKKKLKVLLTQIDTGHGAYLVTGYRGMGKTSMVREVLNDIKKSSDIKTLEHFEFSLSQDEVKDIDLLKQIGWRLHDYIDSEIKPGRVKRQFLWNKIFLVIKTICIIFLVLLLNGIYNTSLSTAKELLAGDSTKIMNFFWNGLMNPFNSASSGGYIFLYFGMITATIYFLNILFQGGAVRGKDKIYKQIFEKSDLLNKRLYSSLTQENQNGIAKVNLGSHNPISYMTNKILEGGKSTISANKKDTIMFSIATPKEIEKYIIDILADLEKLRSKPYNIQIPLFVFIIDELDKVEPDYFFAPGDRESDKFIHHNDAPFHIPTKARMRQEAIAKLLANLKNFLNKAEAKFVFIGGRGMYDASLADIADRESFYSSIFHEVIYVESFFKDKLTSQAGVSQITETYLCSLLMTKQENPENYNVKKLISEYKELHADCLNPYMEEKIFKILHTLQNFVIFLTYRSNGSPKKLIELIERYLVLEDEQKNHQNSLFINNRFSSEDSQKKQMYLRLSFRDQYEINLNANFYRPYLIINSKYLKSLGDKLLYSTAFLIDHILKFHKVAFSWRNLELIPDIILSNKDANFRQFYTDIMRFLLRQHLRKTVNAVFQYKFNSKIANEVKFLSKISEFSSAAFNFTLDESYHLKSYYKKKLAAKYKEYQELSSLRQGEGYIHSVGYLHSILGDLHYYDEEYDDAIVHYTDSVQALRQEFINKNKLLSHQFVLYTRNNLNLGLCLEKTRSYDKAYSVYRSLIIQLQNFQNMSEGAGKNTPANPLGLLPKWETPFKRMQLFLRPHVALLNVIEKQRQDGITYDNLERNLQEYLRFLMLDVENTVKLFPIGRENKVIDYRNINTVTSTQTNDLFSKAESEVNDNDADKIGMDKKRLTSLITDYYFSVGGMLFFKNQIFYRLLYRDKRNGDLISEIIKKRMNDIIAVNKESNKSTAVYHPSHAAYLYYLHALITFNAPFHENIDKLRESTQAEFDLAIKLANPTELKKLTSTKEKKLKNLISVSPEKNHSILSHLKFTTNYLNKDIYSILNSNQLEVLANICAKLGDAILGCLNNEDLKIANEKDAQNFIKIVNLFANESIDDSNKKNILEAEEKLSLNLVFILYRLSYLFYMKAGKSYSANFQYKKLLYVLNDSCDENVLRNSYLLPEKQRFLYKEYKKAKEDQKNKEPAFKKVINQADVTEEQISALSEYLTVLSDLAEIMLSLVSTLKINFIIEKLKQLKNLIRQAKNSAANGKFLLIKANLESNSTLADKIILEAGECIGKVKEVVFKFHKELKHLQKFEDEVDLQGDSIPSFLLIDQIASILLKKQVEITGVSNRAQLRKYRKHTEEKPCYQSQIYQNLSTSPEVREIIILAESLKAKIFYEYHPKLIVGPYATISSMFTRTLELKYQSDLEINSLKKALNIKSKEFIGDVQCVKLHEPIKIASLNKKLIKNYKKIVPNLANAYFCLNSVIRILNTYGVSYILTHSFLAAMNKRMGVVSFYIKQLVLLEKDNEVQGNHLQRTLDELIGKDYIYNIDAYHYWDLAKLHYQDAIKLHTEGNVYKDFSHQMYTLDDDFNDNLTHFCAASERYRVNTQRIQKQIDTVNAYLENSKLYNYKMYHEQT